MAIGQCRRPLDGCLKREKVDGIYVPNGLSNEEYKYRYLRCRDFVITIDLLIELVNRGASHGVVHMKT